MKTLLAIVCLGVSIACHAQTPDMPAPVKTYKAMADIRSHSCELAGRSFLLSLSAATKTDSDDCLDKARRGLAEDFKAAIGPLSGRARDAFKEAHIARLGYLNTLSPNVDERSAAYAARLRAAREKCDEMWTRFEMEFQAGS